MFDQFWKSLRGGKDKADERRAHRRHPINVETTCQSVGDADATEKVHVRDISRGGMKFFIDKKLEPGTLIRVNLPGTAESQSAVLACVMHASQQSDGSYAIGCAFSDELGDVELRHFGARREMAQSSDKRAWMRFPANGVAEYLVLPPTGEAARHAEIANISATGIGLYLEERVEPGVILDLLLKTNTGEQVFDILACVVFLGRRSEGGWVAGCHFIRELQEADLKRLV